MVTRQNFKNRTFGWVQNPSKFENLKRVVQIFIPGSSTHQEIQRILMDPRYMRTNDISQSLCLAINKPLKDIVLSYQQLVGTGTNRRKDAKCDGLAQASVKSQRKDKPYVDDWTADGFVRWAECLGLIEYQPSNDSFTLTDRGLRFGTEEVDLVNEPEASEALVEGLLEYPPVNRVLSLLEKDNYAALSKFEIASQLGFAGEDGFTFYPHKIIVRQLELAADNKEITRICSDTEGSSDKYARMICTWLCKVGWVRRSPLRVYNQVVEREVTLGHNYEITGKGMHILNRIRGRSRHKQTEMRVSWYMLATNAKNKVYLRNRRALILLFLNTSARPKSIESIQEHLESKGISSELSTIKKDIHGLIGCGIDINEKDGKYSLVAAIKGLKLPSSTIERTPAEPELESLKEHVLSSLKSLDPSWVELIEISRNGKNSRILEARVMELFGNECNLGAVTLGAASRPDGLLYHINGKNWGIIVDTKAYANGFNFTVTEEDKMVRYITENKDRDEKVNPTKWWDNFPRMIDRFAFLYVSSYFSANSEKSLQKISRRTNTTGAMLDIVNLLYIADYYSENKSKIGEFLEYFDNCALNSDDIKNKRRKIK